MDNRGYPLDRSWVYDRLNPGRGGLKPRFVKGVKEFIKQASSQPQVASEGGIRCPCLKCMCRSILSAAEIRVHLGRVGFQPNYWYWTEHGEEVPYIGPSNVATGGGDDVNDDPFLNMQHMVDDVFRPNNDFEGMGDDDNEEDEEEIFEESPNKDAQDFYDLLIAANQPLYEGASESKLSICVKLLACKSNWNVPQKCIDFFASMLVAVCPSKDALPKNYYQAQRLVSMLGLKSEQIDCCKDGCMLYWKDNENDRECKFCNEPRYLPRKIGMGKHKDVPVKRMFYLPITPRLKRLYASTETAAQMRWHHQNRSTSGVLRHPSDGEAWKHFDLMYPDFANEPRNVRLGLCSDGFTPYVQASSTAYSCWPVVVTPYNLPPEMCMTKPFMFLTCLIPGPRNPKAKIDVFLQPLIDELRQLWSDGALTYDISTKQNFVMRATLMWTINDFPAYGMLSGWGTQGKLACPICMNDTKSFRLKYGGKNSWFDCHRRFLPLDHTFRRSRKGFTKKRVEKDGPPNVLTGDEIRNLVHGLPYVPVDGVPKIPGYGVTHNWVKRSIFWDLPY